MGVESLLLSTMAAGTGLGAFGNIKAGRQAKRAAEFEAQAAETTAQEIEHAGLEEQRQLQRRGRFAVGAQRAGFAKGGVRTTEGSPLEVVLDSANELERGLFEMRRQTTAEAAEMRFRGRQARSRGRAAQTAGFLGAGSTILGGIGPFVRTGRDLEETSRSGFTFPF